MGKDEEQQLEDKPLGRDGVNLLGKAAGERTKGRLDGFAIVLNQKGLGRMIGSLAVPRRAASSRLPVASANTSSQS